MKLAIIGGSLLGEMAELEEPSRERIKTPFGEPSDKLTIGKINGREVIYLNRHGKKHHLAPHHVNYRANMFALKILEVTHVIAVTAVGGITQKMSPMSWIVPDQLIDYTYGRMQTYNDSDEHEVDHIDFSYPFDDHLRSALIDSIRKDGIDVLSSATYGVTQGPRLETIAEILKFERDGCDIVGMTLMPEAALSRELQIKYATLSLVVNWAAGKDHIQQSGIQGNAEPVSLEEIRQRITEGNTVITKLINNVVSSLL